MVAIIDEFLIGSSATALITYLMAKIRCIIRNPCTENQLCIYGSNESNITIEDENNEIVIIAAKKTKHYC
jgi:hypothetical protein